MSYQVLARKWRPRSFPEMVGQEHVLRALINALDNDRLHHAFLFTGTRGVGKTSVARILAKSLNCEQGVSSRPCGECSACREIDEGRFVDLVEVDAASRTRVEDTRELLENVQYAPSRGRYKVYLVDEVHMLSNHSFNALLKTLEEPPPHVKFLLATTDPQRLPVTILSRCLQFNLKRLPLEPIRDHLAAILEKEGVEADPTALAEIARAADGSMRDALSLLDQAIAYGAGRLDAAEVRDMLGTVDRHQVAGLIEALAGGDAEQVIASSNLLAERAPDFGGVLNELNSLLQRIALAQVVPSAVDDSGGDAATIRGLAERISPEDVQLYYQIGIAGRRDLPLAPDTRSGFEMVLLRMLAFRPAETVPAGGGGAAVDPSRRTAPTAGNIPPVSATPPQPSAPKAKPPRSRSPAEKVAPDPAPAPVAQPPAEHASSAPPVDRDNWDALVAALPLAGMSQQFALHCALARRNGDRFELVLDQGVEHLSHNSKWEQALKEALESYLGRSVQLSVTVGTAPDATPHQLKEQRTAASQNEAEQAIRNDPRLNAFLERFDGEVDPGSIRPVE
ncbi:DNA polymerase III subunit gamma/tau [Thiohalomonas denitrificans]|uniref:DNA polymerase III subunit gamma/tau n=1 Tax=Thiohalomonas denitrificans TaxID=415747 RepID=A0A1G5Q3R8_9GAMM|nr:DNA polymerase III subunit gamma/tau [Thiohalomonas denitrificans]SCZ56312.1 DNA polymerase III, gamma subunit /DNA polymerase III, tau subunit [Thiohalomonas denitrificans]